MRLPQRVGCVQRTSRNRFRCVARTLQFVCAGLALAVTAGCGSGSSKTSETAKDDPKDVATHATPDLPKLGDQMPVVLDEGRLKVSPPEGWITPPRTKNYVVHFKAGSKLIYPVIGISADDYEGIDDVTKENVEQFAKQVGEAVAKSGGKCSHPVRPYSFGDWVGVTYERKGKSGNFIVDRRILETVVGNRKYSFELLALDGTVEKYWPHLLAVAAGVEYVKAGAEAPPKEKPAEKTPAERPAEPEKKPEPAVEITPDKTAEKTPATKPPAKKPSFEEDI